MRPAGVGSVKSDETTDELARCGPKRPNSREDHVVALSKAKDRLKSTTDDAVDRVGPAAGSARDTVAAALDDTRQRVGPALSDASKIGSALGRRQGPDRPRPGRRQGQGGPGCGETRDRIAPLLDDAREPGRAGCGAGDRREQRRGPQSGRLAAAGRGAQAEPQVPQPAGAARLSGPGSSLQEVLRSRRVVVRCRRGTDAGARVARVPGPTAPPRPPPVPRRPPAPRRLPPTRPRTSRPPQGCTGCRGHGQGRRQGRDRQGHGEGLRGEGEGRDEEVGRDKTEPTNKNETAPTAPLASEETVESHEPSTPDNPLEETKIDTAEGS